MLSKIALTSALAMAATSSFAADLPSRTAAPAAPYLAPVPVFSWTGFYVGVNAGGAFNGGRNNNYGTSGFPVGANGNPAVIFGNTGVSNNGSFTGGAQVGYNWQMNQFVFGVEADIQGIARNSGGGASATAPVAGLAGVVPYAIASNGANVGNYFGTVRGRLGFAYDRALFYVTGGLAYGDTRGGGTINYYNATNGTGVPTATYTSNGGGMKTGYALGAGMEYAVAHNWTVRGEYMYVDLGRRNNAFTSPTLPTTSISGGNASRGLQVVRLGVNYKF